MAPALSILLIMIGAALVWAISDSVGGVDTTSVGIAAMVVGGFALLASLFGEARREAARQAAMRRGDEPAEQHDDPYDVTRLR